MKLFIVFLIFITTLPFIFGDDFIIDEPGANSNTSSPVKNNNPPPENFPAKTMNSIGSVETPSGLGKGAVLSEFTMYENGGVNARFVVGIMDAIDIGISENLDGLIGSGNINVNIPMAYVKVTLLRDLNNFNWAFGFDSFAYGEAGTYYPSDTNLAPSTIYGFYTAVGWHYSAIGGNDVLSTGLRTPLLPAEEENISNTSFFIGATISAPQYVSLGFTLENFFFDFSRAQYILPSLIFSFVPTPPFDLSLILQYDFNISRLDRIFSLSYETGF
jgi:hypothetical protein